MESFETLSEDYERYAGSLSKKISKLGGADRDESRAITADANRLIRKSKQALNSMERSMRSMPPSQRRQISSKVAQYQVLSPFLSHISSVSMSLECAFGLMFHAVLRELRRSEPLFTGKLILNILRLTHVGPYFPLHDTSLKTCFVILFRAWKSCVAVTYLCSLICYV